MASASPTASSNCASGRETRPRAAARTSKQFLALRSCVGSGGVVTEPLSLSLGQKFELERMSRAIDETQDPQTLQRLAKQLLQAWHSQKAATQWVMRQQLER